VLALLGGQADHRDAERALLAAGWTACGAGDWAIALRSPDGRAAARGRKKRLFLVRYLG
jgi:hypothetical protein